MVLGDTVQCTVCEIAPWKAAILFMNESQNMGTLFRVDMPHDANSFGTTAEWIVENPTNPDSNGLADYGEVVFDNTLAILSNGTNLDLGAGTFLYMEPANRELSVPTCLTDQSMRVNWLASS